MTALRATLLALLALAVLAAGGCSQADRPAGARVVVLGFDGLDPALLTRWMADGSLPHFAGLAQNGHFQALPTTTPAQSPVAWASFATGANPGAHGIFDFLRRDLGHYTPEFSIAEVKPPQHVLDLLGYRIPLAEPTVRNRRQGEPFWLAAERQGLRSSVLRVPVTFPPDPIQRMIAGMGVPDLLGTQGTFTFYTTAFDRTSGTGGRVVQVRAEAGRVETILAGPPNPLKAAATPLEVPMVIEPLESGKAWISLDDRSLTLAPGQWSDWLEVRFRYAPWQSITGMVRLHLVEGLPRLKLYVSPINLDPRAPVLPISSPPAFAGELAGRIGLYHTLGMAEETWSLNERRISDAAYIDLVKTVLKEQEAMFFDTLNRHDSELVVTVFVQPDRISHMFWRGQDERHPLYAETDATARAAVQWIYQEADRVLGATLAALAPNDRLLVLSDHGFAAFRRAVHLNRWLVEQGLMALRPGRQQSDSLFAQVDWNQTQAYALGLNGLYLNRHGREAQGIVTEAEVDGLKREIREKLLALRDPVDGAVVVREVYDSAAIYHGDAMADAPDLVIGYAPAYRASWQTALGGVPKEWISDNAEKWSGDHLIDPPAVPGVLLANFKLDQPLRQITDVAALVLQTLQSRQRN
ncbi:MAG: alkaline phosphatase family protein [Gammaproteobacteria bacterium]